MVRRGRAGIWVIRLGEGWLVERGRVFQACGPDVYVPLAAGGMWCDCGSPVPERVRLLRAWLLHARDAVMAAPESEGE